MKILHLSIIAILIIDMSSMLISNVEGYGVQSPPSTVIPPLKILEEGYSIKDVKCNLGFSLVFKAEDGSPACVTSNTAQKLIERGWTKNPTGVSALAKPLIGIYNLTLSTNPIILGIPFYINAVVVNHRTEPITYYSGCTSSLSVSFDSIKTSTGNVHCLAISKYTLEPNQSVPVQSDKIETLYNATRPNTTTNAQIKFSYEADGKPISIFTSMQIPIQTAIMIDCSTNVLLHVSQIDKTVNVTKAIALAYTSPEFA
ncbi:MAG: hypothetical protein KGH76_06610, partial [Thaumarchaeota archaeon]|nr:hypothetical protein [Nitrososphaerota archaeon]